MNNRDNENKVPQRRMSRSNRGNFEKPKNLSLTVKKLFSYLKSFMPFIIVALIFAGASSVFSIIGPNKLSDLTDELSKGLVLDKNKIEVISKDISSTLNEENIKEITTKIYKNEDISGVSDEDKATFMKIISSMDKNDSSAMIKSILDMPKSIQRLLLPESTINKKKITTDDKVIFLKEMSGITKKSSAKDIYAKLDKLPNSISSLIKPSINMNAVKKIVIFLLTIYLVSALFNFLEGFIMSSVANDFARNLRTKISIKINKLALKYFDSHSNGDILSRVTNDVDTVAQTMSQSLGSFVSAIALFIGCVIMMFKTNWILAITAILSSLIGFIFMSFILGKSQKYFLARQVELGKLNGHIEEIYSSHNVVKAYNGNYDAEKKFDKLNENVFECNRMSQFLSGLMPSMMNFIGNFGYVAVCVVGALLTINGNISFGVIVAFMLYVRLFTSPLSQIAQGMTSLQSTCAAAERVFEFVEEDEMEDEKHLKKKLNAKKVKGNIEFKHVKFGYDKDKVIINDFNCKVKPGQKIAIVGPTGAGKTTMVNLLMKFYNINDGDILIDGVSVKELKRENIHDLFIMVLQDTWLFNGSIRDNIKYNKKNVSDETIEKALETVGVLHFVKSLPGGLDYEITDSNSISAGQKQLLTIARGMVKDAPFLILDEATSSVDTRTEELVQKAMDKLTKGRTSFIIAHRLSTIKNADLILVMKDGNIIEQGNHKKLMEKNGFYADLYNSQFKN
jgi:ATP-binding cassette subfamily B multidrug efflux pump